MEWAEKMAPEAVLEPATFRLTAGRSTIELLWIPNGAAIYEPLLPASTAFPLPEMAPTTIQTAAKQSIHQRFFWQLEQ